MNEILDKIFALLAQAVKDRHSPLHTPCLATIGADGAARPRIVVLRKCEPNERVLIFHTHRGAPKVAEIERDKRVAWLFYHAAEKMQFRIEAEAEVLTDGAVFETQWRLSKPFSRRCYMGEAPSRTADAETSGLPSEIVDREPSLEESESGRENFAVVRTVIKSIDCLELYFTGNRRSLFFWNAQNELETCWLTP